MITSVKEWLLETRMVDKQQVESDADLTDEMEYMDLEDLLNEYADTFNVEIPNHGYWYHYISTNKLLWYDAHELVDHIPIRPSMLSASAEAHKWLVEYPSKEKPPRKMRSALGISGQLLNRALTLAAIGGIIWLIYRIIKLIISLIEFFRFGGVV